MMPAVSDLNCSYISFIVNLHILMKEVILLLNSVLNWLCKFCLNMFVILLMFIFIGEECFAIRKNNLHT